MNTNTLPSSETQSQIFSTDIYPLPRVRAGQTVRIRSLNGSQEVSCRLRELGLCEGQLVRLITCGSNVICQVCNARLALNTCLAQIILVEQFGGALSC